jgi:gliding motility-associated-like protein
MSDGSAQLTVNAGTQPYSYNWNSTPAQNGQNLQNVPMGTYSVTVTDANSCTATANVTIGQTGGPTATATSTNEICDQANGTATVVAQNGSGTYTYLWSNGQVTSTATGLAAGTYTVTIDDGACTTIATAGVMNIPGPNAGFSAHPTVVTPMDGPVSFLDNSSGNIVGWQWNFGDGSPLGSGETTTHPYENIGEYLVTLIVTDNNGCTDTTVDTIKVKEIFTFYIPNVFTPNGDGINDLFTPKGLSVDPNNFNMQIFDRWGNVMFQTNKWLINSAEPWNGTQNNSGTIDDVVMDVYVYRIRLKEIDGPKHDYIGRIALIP